MIEMRAHNLLKYKNWVVVGDVANPAKYANKILNRFTNQGYNVTGVNPRGNVDEVYKSLSDVPYKIEALDLCINPVAGLEIVKEAKDLGIKHILIQPGAESKEIIDYCKQNEINAIEGCALIELSQM